MGRSQPRALQLVHPRVGGEHATTIAARHPKEGRNGSRPQGWETVAHCGDTDCDEVTRRRDTTGHDGLPTTTLCQRCHPAMRF